MSSISKPLIRGPDTSLLSPPLLLSFIKPSQQCLCISSNPISIQTLSTKLKLPSIITHVAQKSDWAQQEEEGEMNAMPVTESENEEFDGTTWENQSGPQASNWAGEEREEDGFVEPPEEAKIYVGNLPYDVDSQRMAMLFEKAGTVEIAEVIYNRDTDTSRGFGFVTMSTVEEAEKAVDLFNRYEIEGRLLTVTKAAPKGSRPERAPRGDSSGSKMYVGNIPWDIDNGRLEQIFSEYGKVVEARVVYDRESGRSRGFGFVTMATKIEMDDAIAALDGQSLDGRTIRVNVAEDKPRRRF